MFADPLILTSLPQVTQLDLHCGRSYFHFFLEIIWLRLVVVNFKELNQNVLWLNVPMAKFLAFNVSQVYESPGQLLNDDFPFFRYRLLFACLQEVSKISSIHEFKSEVQVPFILENIDQFHNMRALVPL